MTATYFGEHWGVAALNDAFQAPTPVGRLCITCTDPIRYGDRGWLRPTVLIDGRASLVAIHAECELATIVGHTLGICSCNGWPAGSRYTGLAVWHRLMSDHGLDAAPHDPYGSTVGLHCDILADTARLDLTAIQTVRGGWLRRTLRRLTRRRAGR